MSTSPRAHDPDGVDRRLVCEACGVKWFVPSGRPVPVTPPRCGSCGGPLAPLDAPAEDPPRAGATSPTEQRAATRPRWSARTRANAAATASTRRFSSRRAGSLEGRTGANRGDDPRLARTGCHRRWERHERTGGHGASGTTILAHHPPERIRSSPTVAVRCRLARFRPGCSAGAATSAEARRTPTR